MAADSSITQSDPTKGPSQPGEASDNLYVYALMRSSDAADLDFRPVDAPDTAPMAFDCGHVQVIVSPIAADEVLSTRRNMLTHARALEQLMSGGPVLPMRFGLITTTAEDIQATIAAHAARILAHLDDLDGCVEMGVKITWDRAAVMQEIVAETPQLAKTYQSLQARPEKETHYERVELGRRVEALMREKRSVELDQYDAILSAIARDRVLQDPEDELMVLKADYLVAAHDEPELQAALEQIEARKPGRLSVSYVGPSPAYNFCRLQLDWASPDMAAIAGGQPPLQQAG